MACCTNNFPCIGSLRTYVIIANIFNTILGAVLFAVSCVLAFADSCDTTCPVTPGRLSLGLFSVSIFILTLGISGIAGACLRIRNWGIILHLWLAVFSVLLHFLVMAGLLKLTDVDDLETAVSTKFAALYADYSDGFLATVGIDIVQGVMQCCGSTASSDFATGGAATDWIADHTGYPCSCCTWFSCDNTTSPSNLHSNGCTSLMSTYSGEGLDWTAAGMTATFFLSLISLAFVYILINNRKEPCSPCCCWCCVPYASPADDTSPLTEAAV
jgi:hypothetical protein